MYAFIIWSNPPNFPVMWLAYDNHTFPYHMLTILPVMQDLQSIPHLAECITQFTETWHISHNRACGAMDNASDYGSEDSRFESWQARISWNIFSHSWDPSICKFLLDIQLVSVNASYLSDHSKQNYPLYGFVATASIVIFWCDIWMQHKVAYHSILSCQGVLGIVRGIL